ncbi:aldo/keto reductase [Haloarchaeobius amylolyticus]|uniref:aldo/keto reductase n=1 Tax=Haloarchaeobius amylolyticus TaxID=1198296 RepID=UPI00226F08B5|nr:aldo/keto reductase [Haloarchaeobius amylolyticus]
MTLPLVGLGTMGIDDPDAIASALDAGYRHLDTAQIYENEGVVGEGLAKSDVPREDVFLATKVWATNLAPEDVRESTAASLDRLGVDSVDLLYVHRPIEAYDPATTLPAFDDLVEDGLTKHVGVSNFTKAELATAREHLDAPIFAHQIEYHPFFQTPELLADNRAHDETVVAYSPLAQGKVFDDPTLQDIADSHDATPADVAIAWLCQKEGVVTIPKAAGRTHQEGNLAAADIGLSEAECARIDDLDRGEELFPE